MTGSRRLGLVLLASALGAAVLFGTRASPGTVAEQRARLPPAAKCGEDPVIGYWRSHQFLEFDQQWTEFTLEIHRKGGPDSPTLAGKILNHSWQAGPGREQAGECGADQPYRLRFSMTAEGEANGNQIAFGGTSYKLDEVVCGQMPPGLRYNLDRFTGTIDAERQEFQSVNNDGGRMVNHPTVFRRVRCFGDGPPPSVKIEPPPLFPKSSAGCGCSLGACGS